MTLFRLWMLASGLLLGGFMVYEYAPLLIPLATTAALLGGVVAGIFWLTRRHRKPDLQPGERP